MNSYVVRLQDGTMRFAYSLSALAAADLVLGHASPQPPSHDPMRPPACFVREQSSSATEEPFWHAEGVA